MCFCCVRFSFFKRLARKNVSEMTYFVSSGTQNLNSINQVLSCFTFFAGTVWKSRFSTRWTKAVSNASHPRHRYHCHLSIVTNQYGVSICRISCVCCGWCWIALWAKVGQLNHTRIATVSLYLHLRNILTVFAYLYTYTVFNVSDVPVFTISNWY